MSYIYFTKWMEKERDCAKEREGGTKVSKKNQTRGHNKKINSSNNLGRIPSLVVMGGDSYFEDGAFESQHHILDGHFAHTLVVKIVMFV